MFAFFQISHIYCIQIISGHKIQYNKNVKFYSQKLENVGKALKFVRDQGIKLVAIGPEDIVEKRIKLILGLIWTIILRYQINKVEYTSPDTSSRSGTGMSYLLMSNDSFWSLLVLIVLQPLCKIKIYSNG